MNALARLFPRPAKQQSLMAAAIVLSLMGMSNPVAAGSGASTMRADGSIADQFKEQIAALTVPEPSKSDPVSVASAVFPAQVRAGQRAVVVVKVRMAPGWHIYAYVPPSEPYIVARKQLELPSSLQAAGDWQNPPARPYDFDTHVFVWEDEQSFTREIKVVAGAAGKQTLSAGLFYQTCNRRVCLPPTKKLTSLALTIS